MSRKPGMTSNTQHDNSTMQQQQQQHSSTSTKQETMSSSVPPGTTQQQSSSSSFMQQYPTYHCHRVLDQIFVYFSDDPIGNIHRTWAISLIAIVIYFILSILEGIYLHGSGTSSRALIVASIWLGTIQFLGLGLVGTVILKRFPTSFAIGFLLGLVIVFINQHIIYFSTFRNIHLKNSSTNSLFSAFSILLVLILLFFGTLVFHFQQYVIVAPIDAKGFGNRNTHVMTTTIINPTSAPNNGTSTTTYHKYDDGSEI